MCIRDRLPEIEEEIKVVTYVAGIGDISTDLLSPGNQAHSRSDRELHGQCFISKQAQNEITKLKSDHPEKSIMLVAEKGTMGVGSSRMSGVNNVALWTGKKASPYIPYVNVAPIVAGTNGISPIFLTTVGVTGGIGIDLKNWVKKKDSDGNVKKAWYINGKTAWEYEDNTGPGIPTPKESTDRPAETFVAEPDKVADLSLEQRVSALEKRMDKCESNSEEKIPF